MTRTNVHKTNQTILISCNSINFGNKVHTNESCFPSEPSTAEHLCKKFRKSKVISESYSSMDRKVDCLRHDPEKSKAKNLFTCFISSIIVLKLLLHGKCKHECHDDKTIQEPRKTQGPYNGMFWRQDWDVNHTTQPPFLRTRSLWSHFLFSGVSLDETAALTPRRIWPHPKQNFQWANTIRNQILHVANKTCYL